MRPFRDILLWFECFRRTATKEEAHLLSSERRGGAARPRRGQDSESARDWGGSEGPQPADSGCPRRCSSQPGSSRCKQVRTTAPASPSSPTLRTRNAEPAKSRERKLRSAPPHREGLGTPLFLGPAPPPEPIRDLYAGTSAEQVALDLESSACDADGLTLRHYLTSQRHSHSHSGPAPHLPPTP